MTAIERVAAVQQPKFLDYQPSVIGTERFSATLTVR